MNLIIKPYPPRPPEALHKSTPVRFSDNPMFKRFGAPFRAEVDLRDCEVEGEIPSDLDGAFYRVGPDYQYPPRCPENIPFDAWARLAGELAP